MTAPFAVHPKDRDRAVRAFFLAHRVRVSIDAVCDEAEEHLFEQGASASLMRSELDRVRLFWDSWKLTGSAKSRWLVFWNSTEKPVFHSSNQLIAAFDTRLSTDRITDFMTCYYLAQEATVREKIYFATRRKQNPYVASFAGDWDGKRIGYTCGHNPWIESRVCRNVTVYTACGEEQIVGWESDSMTLANSQNDLQ
jgi:hypothetical protein